MNYAFLVWLAAVVAAWDFGRRLLTSKRNAALLALEDDVKAQHRVFSDHLYELQKRVEKVDAVEAMRKDVGGAQTHVLELFKAENKRMDAIENSIKEIRSGIALRAAMPARESPLQRKLVR